MDTKKILIIMIIAVIACTLIVVFAATVQNTNQNIPANVTNASSSIDVETISQETEQSQGDSGQHKSTAELALEWSGTSDGKVSDVISDGDKSKADYLNSQIDHVDSNRVYYKDGSSAEIVDKS